MLRMLTKKIKKYQYRKSTSFSVLKRVEYNNAEDVQKHSERLLKLKKDKFEGRIKVPYFEFEVEGPVMIIQSEYIKGRPPLEQQYLNHLKVKLFAMIADYNYTHQTSPDK